MKQFNKSDHSSFIYRLKCSDNNLSIFYQYYFPINNKSKTAFLLAIWYKIFIIFNFDYLYEPEAKDVLEFVLGRYVESLVFQGILENYRDEIQRTSINIAKISKKQKDV